ncbi:MAG TPA: hypothetical protein VII69_10820 [Candidatus Eremiobacteraceae bacterium]
MPPASTEPTVADGEVSRAKLEADKTWPCGPAPRLSKKRRYFAMSGAVESAAPSGQSAS